MIEDISSPNHEEPKLEGQIAGMAVQEAVNAEQGQQFEGLQELYGSLRELSESEHVFSESITTSNQRTTPSEHGWQYIRVKPRGGGTGAVFEQGANKSIRAFSSRVDVLKGEDGVLTVRVWEIPKDAPIVDHDAHKEGYDDDNPVHEEYGNSSGASLRNTDYVVATISPDGQIVRAVHNKGDSWKESGQLGLLRPPESTTSTHVRTVEFTQQDIDKLRTTTDIIKNDMRQVVYLQMHPRAEKDFDRAEDRAVASRSERNRAAASRTTAKDVQELATIFSATANEHKTAIEDHAQTAQRFKQDLETKIKARDETSNRERRDTLSREIELTRNALSGERAGFVDGVLSSYDDKEAWLLEPSVNRAAEGVTDGANFKSRVAEDLNNRQKRFAETAVNFDAKAERIEAWAGILYDNPPSAAFKAEFSGKGISASELAMLELFVEEGMNAEKATLEAIDKIFKENPTACLDGDLRDSVVADLLDQLSGEDRPSTRGDLVRNYLRKNHGSLLQDLSDKQDPASGKNEYSARLDEWNNMLKNPDTTLGQLNDAYVATVKELISGSLDYYKINQAFLGFISSGRAAQWQ